MQGYTSTSELEKFLLEYGEQIIDRLGSEVDRIELNIKVSDWQYNCKMNNYM